MAYAAPLIREICENCNGSGAYLETEKEHDAEGWWQRTVEHECERCNGSGWIVTEVYPDVPVVVTSIIDRRPTPEVNAAWDRFRARLRDSGMVS